MLPRHRPVLALLALVSVTPGWGLASQSPSDRALLDQADQRVGRAEAMPSPDSAGDNVARDMITGLVELDAFVTRGDRRSVERALERFARASARRPEWGWPEYAFAHAFLLMHDTESPTVASAGARLGEDHVDAMWRHLRLALTRDPDLAPARTLLSELVREMGDRELPSTLVDLLRTEVSRPDARASALIAWARHQRGTGNGDLALAIQRAALVAGADPSVVALDQAYALASLGRIPEAVVSYRNGLVDLSPPGRDRYRQDLGWAIPPDLFHSIEELDDPSAARAMLAYWDGSPGRLESHLAAWPIAHGRYRVPATSSRPYTGWIDHAFDYVHHSCGGEVLAIEELPPIGFIPLPGDVRRAEPSLSLGGRLLLQHGMPDLWIGRGVTPTSENVPHPTVSILTEALQGLLWSQASEAWVYRTPGGFRLYALRTSAPEPLGPRVVGWDLGLVSRAVLPMVAAATSCHAPQDLPSEDSS